jgi:hypothetical protein
MNTFKHRIETWLKGLVAEVVADEVSKIDTALNAERTAMVNIFASVCADVNAAVDRLNELSHIKENAALRAHIKDLTSGLVEVGDKIKKLHPHQF